MSSRVVHVASDGPPVARAAELVELALAAGAEGEDWIALPVARLAPAFFDLRSGVAGEIVQTCVNYRIRLAVIGDIADRLARSSALAAFVAESNRGRQVWFVADEAELHRRLAPGPAGPS